jgi:hypothetical protein
MATSYFQDPFGAADYSAEGMPSLLSLSNLESLGRGSFAGLLGLPEDLRKMLVTKKMQQNMDFVAAQSGIPQVPYFLPSSEELKQRTPRMTAPTPQAGLIEDIGAFMSPVPAAAVAPLARGVGKVGKAGLRMAGQEITDVMSGMPSRSLLGDITPKPMFMADPSAGLLGQTKPKDESIRIYRGSFETNPEYSVLENYPNAVYNGVFGSSNLQSAQGHGSGAIHFTDIPKSKIVTHYELNYEIPYEKIKNALLKERPDLKNNPELFDELYDIVVGDAGQNLQKHDDNKIINLFRTSPDEADNEAQRLRGLVAKNLGYKAIEMTDEHGAGTYLVTPGAKFKSIAGDPQEYGYNPNFEYPQQAALDLAQQRAALPVEQSGLGLPINNTAADRAKAMGFDTDAYHSTNASDITKFDLGKNSRGEGTSVALTPENAQAYGDITYPLKVNQQKIFDPTNKDQFKELKNYVENLIQQQKPYDKDSLSFYPFTSKKVLENLSNPQTGAYYLENEIISKSLKDLGYSGSIGMESGQSQLKMFDPDNIRSRFASFDPFRKDVATAAAMGVAAPNLLAAEPKPKEKRRQSSGLLSP